MRILKFCQLIDWTFENGGVESVLHTNLPGILQDPLPNVNLYKTVASNQNWNHPTDLQPKYESLTPPEYLQQFGGCQPLICQRSQSTWPPTASTA